MNDRTQNANGDLLVDALSNDGEDIQDCLLRELIYLLPGRYAMLSAFLDESGTHQGAPSLIVGGLMFDEENLRLLNSEWKEALSSAGVTLFHAKEHAHLQGEFREKSREQANTLQKQLIGLLNKHSFAGIAVACFAQEARFDSLRAGKWKYGRYSTCACVCMLEMFELALQENHEQISFFIESGHEDQAELAKLAEIMRKNYNGFPNCIFLSKHALRLLQAADILVYEVNKWFTDLDVAERKQIERRPVRKSLEVLVAGKNIRLQSLNEDNLPEFFADWARLFPLRERLKW